MVQFNETRSCFPSIDVSSFFFFFFFFFCPLPRNFPYVTRIFVSEKSRERRLVSNSNAPHYGQRYPRYKPGSIRDGWNNIEIKRKVERKKRGEGGWRKRFKTEWISVCHTFSGMCDGVRILKQEGISFRIRGGLFSYRLFPSSSSDSRTYIPSALLPSGSNPKLPLFKP